MARLAATYGITPLTDAWVEVVDGDMVLVVEA